MSEPVLYYFVDRAHLHRISGPRTEEARRIDLVNMEVVPVAHFEALQHAHAGCGLRLVERQDLPDRRAIVRQSVKIGGTRFYVDVGLWPDGTPGEVFLILSKTGSDERGWVDNLARSVSLMLQCRVPLALIVELYLGTKFEPQGMVDGDERIKLASSPLDYLARFLAVYYNGRDDLAHVPAEPTPAPSESAA